MNTTQVELLPLDEDSLKDLLAAAVADSDPLEVMPPVDGPAGWNEARRQAFLEFHWARSLRTENPVETTYVIVANNQVVGAARLEPKEDGLEAGVWIGISHRGQGIGQQVGALLLREAKTAGAGTFLASTTTDNLAAQALLKRAGAALDVKAGDVEASLDLI